MKKAFAWLMLLMAITLFSVAAAPVKADRIWRALYAGSPHYYGEVGDSKYTDGELDGSWYKAHRTEVGSVSVWNNETHLFVKYSITYSGIGMHETHLAVAIEPSEDVNGDSEINILDADIPQTKKGNPKVGRFPYKHEDLGRATTDTYVIPLSDFEPITGPLVIAAHAALCNGETAWADCGGPDAYFPGNNWATFFRYTVQ